MHGFLKRFIFAVLSLASGFSLGFLILELTFTFNPKLLFRGMALPGPIDLPLTIQKYVVHYSDADAFHWRPDLIRPIPSSEDAIESQVVFTTDEFGFRNTPSLAPTADVVVLGRSVSLGAHLPKPWPALLADRGNYRVINLAQPGGSLELKHKLYQVYGKPRQPQWVVLEVVPSIDILGSQKSDGYLYLDAFLPLLQNLLLNFGIGHKNFGVQSQPIYPISLDLGTQVVELTCCLHYMEFFSLSAHDISQSTDWQAYSQELSAIAEEVKNQGSCLALLLAPTKPDVYFPLAARPEQLDPIVRGLIPLMVDPAGRISPAPNQIMTVNMIQNNAFAGSELIHTWGRLHDIPVIDANSAMVQAILSGETPFMVYDSHWNALGHEIIAQAVDEVLDMESCR